jgi:Transmembrane secretion effector
VDEPLAQAGPPPERTVARVCADALPTSDALPTPDALTPPDGRPPRWRRWPRAVAVDSKPLRHRDFRLLYLGQTVSFAGSMITYVAIPFQVFHLTRSPLAVGLLGLAELAPLLLTALVGGALADAHDRRRSSPVAH